MPPALAARVAQAERAARPATARRSQDVITSLEFATTRDAGSALAALEVLRPGALRRMGGGPPSVVINGAYAGPLHVLGTLPVRDVAGVRLVRAAEAAIAYPAWFGRDGVVAVTLQRPR
jgi:hypothetical protein